MEGVTNLLYSQGEVKALGSFRAVNKTFYQKFTKRYALGLICLVNAVDVANTIMDRLQRHLHENDYIDYVRYLAALRREKFFALKVCKGQDWEVYSLLCYWEQGVLHSDADRLMLRMLEAVKSDNVMRAHNERASMDSEIYRLITRCVKAQKGLNEHVECIEKIPSLRYNRATGFYLVNIFRWVEEFLAESEAIQARVLEVIPAYWVFQTSDAFYRALPHNARTASTRDKLLRLMAVSRKYVKN